jgi:hypothetical protein
MLLALEFITSKVTTLQGHCDAVKCESAKLLAIIVDRFETEQTMRSHYGDRRHSINGQTIVFELYESVRLVVALFNFTST